METTDKDYATTYRLLLHIEPFESFRPRTFLGAPMSSPSTTDWYNAPLAPDTAVLVVGTGARAECEIGCHLKGIGTLVGPSFEGGAGAGPPETPIFVGTGARVDIGIGCQIKGVGTLVGAA